MDKQFDYFSSLSVEGFEEYFSTPRQESETLEFKTGECNPEAIFKEVCAFTNTDGGLIVIGTPAEIVNVSNKKNKVSQGALILCKQNWTPDSIIQMILSGVTPAPIGIKVKQIVGSDGCIYVIYVPKSIRPPHQVKGAYYIRTGTMSQPASHGIVQALFNQLLPIKLNYKIDLLPTLGNLYELSFFINNYSRFPARQIEGFIELAGKIDCRDNTSAFRKTIVNENTCILNQSIAVPHALVASINWMLSFKNLEIRGEYFFMEFYVWAHDSHAIGGLYKIYRDGRLEKFNLKDKSMAAHEFRLLVNFNDRLEG